MHLLMRRLIVTFGSPVCQPGGNGRRDVFGSSNTALWLGREDSNSPTSYGSDPYRSFRSIRQLRPPTRSDSGKWSQLTRWYSRGRPPSSAPDAGEGRIE